MFMINSSLLRFQASVLDDVEKLRNANANRLRQLTRTALDADGLERGFGLTEDDPAVATMAAMVRSLHCGLKEPRRKGCWPDSGNFRFCLEHRAMIDLQDTLRAHPLYPWIHGQKGIGDKQGARLLAAIGDPWWNDLHDRPRTVSELWAYCGYHTLPTGVGDYSVAARRAKGQRANWSAEAKKRAFLISESVVKSGGPWREVYDKRKSSTEGRLHQAPCVRCGPSGKPAQPGSPWSDGHRHADALRVTSKEVLKGLWREAARLHEAAH